MKRVCGICNVGRKGFADLSDDVRLDYFTPFKLLNPDTPFTTVDKSSFRTALAFSLFKSERKGFARIVRSSS